MIQVGQKAPEFSLPSNLEEGGKPGRKISLADYKGKNVVLAFYPLDFSPVCSSEAQCFVSDLTQFSGIGADVLGISVDSVWTHKAFAEKLGIKYPLLADFNPKGEVGKKYGVYLEDKGIQSRTTIVVDKTGTVRWVKAVEIPTVPDTKEMIAELRKLG